MAEFIDCTSLNINFNIHGLATVSYTIVSDEVGLKAYNSINAGGRTFSGYITGISMNQVPGTANWYENHVTLIATAT